MSNIAFLVSAAAFVLAMLSDQIDWPLGAPDKIEIYGFALFMLGASISIQLDEMKKDLKK